MANLKLSTNKCTLAKPEVTFLGHKVSHEGLQPDPRLLESIDAIPVPETVTQVRAFLGLVGYYRRFIKNFSRIATPLYKLLQKNAIFVWNPEQQEAYEELKKKILTKPIVGYPDFQLPFRLYTDASNLGLGAVLAQIQDGRERIICCASRTLTKSEVNYSTTKKECLAVVWGIKNFRNYLISSKFQVYTDHYSLQWLRSMKSESALLHRWASQLEDYQFDILHRPGKSQGHVDGLSRLPIQTVCTEKKKFDYVKTKEIIKRLYQDGHNGKKDHRNGRENSRVNSETNTGSRGHGTSY